MYNIWCEVKKINISIIIIGIIFSIVFITNNTEYVYESFMLKILLIIYIVDLIKCILKYFSLKKYGTIIESIPYELNGELLTINYQLNNGNIIKLIKKKRNWGNTLNIGVTKILINPSKPKQYFIFDPENN